MKHRLGRFAGLMMIALAGAGAQARPVLVAETPGHTKFLIESSSLTDLELGGVNIRQALVLTRSAPDPGLRSGQVAAEGQMQFDCAGLTYREWSTTSIRLDGTRQVVVPPSATRKFSPTRDGSFERKLLQAACTMRQAP